MYETEIKRLLKQKMPTIKQDSVKSQAGKSAVAVLVVLVLLVIVVLLFWHFSKSKKAATPAQISEPAAEQQTVSFPAVPQNPQDANLSYPSYIPKQLIVDMQPITAINSGAPSATGHNVAIKYTSGNPLPTIISLYSSELQKIGWQFSQSTQGSNTILTVQSGSQKATYTLSSIDSNHTQVIMLYSSN